MNKDQQIRRVSCTVAEMRVREAAEGEAPSRTITGYAILFNQRSIPIWEDEHEVAYEIIAPSAVTKELLNRSDIKMTMFHDRQLILARSRNGKGTLSYDVDDKGVSFSFDAPNTVDGDKALELVRRGDLSGCSFAFTTHYYDPAFVSKEIIQRENNKTVITYTVNSITGIYDFTLAADPIYPETSVGAETREFVKTLRELADPKPAEPEPKPEPEKNDDKADEQVREMRRAASQDIIQ